MKSAASFFSKISAGLRRSVFTLSAAKLVLFLIGLCAFVNGCRLVWRPLAWLVAGILLVGFALLIDKHQSARTEE